MPVHGVAHIGTQFFEHDAERGFAVLVRELGRCALGAGAYGKYGFVKLVRADDALKQQVPPGDFLGADLLYWSDEPIEWNLLQGSPFSEHGLLRILHR